MTTWWKTQAEAFAAEGRYREAIDCATALNRTARDPMIEYRLAQWRSEGFDRNEVRVGRPDWPPAVKDLFPGAQGIPEIAGQDLTADHITSAILHHGCLIVRGLIPAGEAAQLADGVDRAGEAFTAAMAGAPLAQTLPWCAPIKLEPGDPLEADRKAWNGPGSIWTVDSPRMLFDLLELFDARGLIAMLTKHLGERPVMSVTKAVLRRVPPTSGTDWHQDGAFMGLDTRTVNIWLSLSHCGDDAPGLDIVSKRVPYIVETGTHGSRFVWSVGPGMAEIAAEGAPVVTPIFEAGDALIFDHLLLHRTGVRPEMSQDRWAIESWFFAPSTYPERQGIVLV